MARFKRWTHGVVASIDLFLDDIFPNTIGKPIFSQTLPMFTGAR